MNTEKVLKRSWYVLLSVMFILTILFFLEIKFMVAGLNILVWDVLAAGIWMFVKLYKWAGRKNTGRRTLVLFAVVIFGVFAFRVILLGLAIYGGWYGYADGTGAADPPHLCGGVQLQYVWQGVRTGV